MLSPPFEWSTRILDSGSVNGLDSVAKIPDHGVVVINSYRGLIVEISLVPQCRRIPVVSDDGIIIVNIHGPIQIRVAVDRVFQKNAIRDRIRAIRASRIGIADCRFVSAVVRGSR